jgi:3-deoxy-D-manno-octulosonate 8-phosphate phosphatase KdsC-like HAD superfamily phosphatase
MSFVPCDSHPLILKKAIFVSKNKGGNGFVREVAETLVGSKNILKILDLMEEA